MATHTGAETLEKAQAEYPGRAHEVTPTHPGEDAEWWVADENHDVFAVGTWDSDTTMTFRNYKP